MVRSSRVYCIWRSEGWQHAMKPDIGSGSLFLHTSLHLTPRWGRGSRRNIVMTFGVEKLEWWDYPMVKKFEDMFIHFERVHERDRRTDGGTDTAWRHRRLHSIARQKSRSGREMNTSTEEDGGQQKLRETLYREMGISCYKLPSKRMVDQ